MVEAKSFMPWLKLETQFESRTSDHHILIVGMTWRDCLPLIRWGRRPGLWIALLLVAAIFLMPAAGPLKRALFPDDARPVYTRASFFELTLGKDVNDFGRDHDTIQDLLNRKLPFGSRSAGSVGRFHERSAH
jgi:hypothetical protein